MSRNRTAPHQAASDVLTDQTDIVAVDDTAGLDTDTAAALTDLADAVDAADAIVPAAPVVIPDLTDRDATVTAYTSGDKRTRAAIRKAIDAALSTRQAELINPATAPDAAMALILSMRTLSETRDALRAIVTPSTNAAVTDYAALLVARIATYRAAVDLMTSDPARFVPEGTDITLVQTMQDITDGSDYLVSDAADVDLARLADPAVAHAAHILASAPLVTGFTGVRRSVAAHLAAWRATVEPGMFATISELSRFDSGIYAPTDRLDGRIAARLFPGDGTCTITGMTPVEATATHPRGVMSV